MNGLYGYWNHKVVGVPMPRTTNHVVMSFDSDHKHRREAIKGDGWM